MIPKNFFFLTPKKIFVSPKNFFSWYRPDTCPEPTIFYKRRLLPGSCWSIKIIQCFFLQRTFQRPPHSSIYQEKKFHLKVFQLLISRVFIVYYRAVFKQHEQIKVEIELKHSTGIRFDFLKLIVDQMYLYYVLYLM